MSHSKSANANDPYLANAKNNYNRFVKWSVISTVIVIATLAAMAVFLL